MDESWRGTCDFIAEGAGLSTRHWNVGRNAALVGSCLFWTTDLVTLQIFYWLVSVAGQKFDDRSPQRCYPPFLSWLRKSKTLSGLLGPLALALRYIESRLKEVARLLLWLLLVTKVTPIASMYTDREAHDRCHVWYCSPPALRAFKIFCF